MRILFTFAGGRGHAEPLIPFARAARVAGHTVAFMGRAPVVAALRTRGFEVFAEEGSSGRKSPTRKPLLELDPEREDRDLRDGFANRLARSRSAGVRALAQRWRPDLIVRDEADFGSAIAAESLGLPRATVLVMAAGSFVRPEVVAAPLDVLRAEYGLPPDPMLAALSQDLVLSPFPPSFRDPAFPLPATAHSFRPAADQSAPDQSAPDQSEPVHGEPGRGEPTPGTLAPTVYFTLGTVFNVESGDLFGRVLTGLRALPANVVVTVGHEIDPAEFDPQPANVHIERYIPQSSLLPRCDLVVSHGGSGTVAGALAHGLPQLVIPMGADQPHNARRCAQLGVGRWLDPFEATPESVFEAASALLTDPAYRQAAARLREEVAALPTPADAVALLEAVAVGRTSPRSWTPAYPNRAPGVQDSPGGGCISAAEG